MISEDDAPFRCPKCGSEFEIKEDTSIGSIAKSYIIKCVACDYIDSGFSVVEVDFDAKHKVKKAR